MKNDRNPNASGVDREMRPVLALCEERKFKLALAKLDSIIGRFPDCSEAHRVAAQAKMELGDIDGAINSAIEALRVDHSNVFALLLMGNLFLRYKKDSETALKYYRDAVSLNPDSSIAISNCAAVLAEEGHVEEATAMFERAVGMEPQNASIVCNYAVMLARSGNDRRAFDVAVDGLTNARIPSQDASSNVRLNLEKVAFQTAEHLCENGNLERLVADEQKRVQEICGKPIKIEEDAEAPFDGVLQNAEVYHRQYHRIAYRPGHESWHHIVIHELVHLAMYCEAEKAGAAMHVVSTPDDLLNFESDFASDLARLRMALPGKGAEEVVGQLRRGFASQLMNCPLDLFVEHRVFNEIPEFRPAQMLSLLLMGKRFAKGLADMRGKDDMFPRKIVRANRIMNLVSSLQLKDLFGFDIMAEYNAPASDIEQARRMYGLYRKAEQSFTPGSEYGIVESFVEELRCGRWISIVPADGEIPSRSEETITAARRERQRTFDEKHRNGGGPEVTAAMTMYMVGALEELDALPIGRVKEIALQIAVVGMGGISPSKTSGYRVEGLPGKEMGGYEMLAYYYVSFAKALPELLPKLNLPFDDAYRNACRLRYGEDGRP